MAHIVAKRVSFRIAPVQPEPERYKHNPKFVHSSETEAIIVTRMEATDHPRFKTTAVTTTAFLSRNGCAVAARCTHQLSR